MNVFRAGVIHDDPDFEHGSWRYRIQTTKITVVFAFNRPDKIKNNHGMLLANLIAKQENRLLPEEHTLVYLKANGRSL